MYYPITTLWVTSFLTSASARSDSLAELHKIAVSIKNCLVDKYPGLCLKQRALEALNESIYTDEPIRIGFVIIEKNPSFNWNTTKNESMPTEISKRNLKLSDTLYDKMQEFIKSRTIRFNVDEAVEEGRKKGGGGGGKGGKGIMLMAGAVACLGAGIMVGKMGMMAMGALMISKMALLLSSIIILKKMNGSGGGGDDGGKEKQIKVIYATTGGGGGDYGKGGGGWHRSLTHEPPTGAYRAHIPQDANANSVYEGY